MLSLGEFCQQSYNRRVTSPGGLGGQCVDVPNSYLHLCYGQAHVFLNAADWAHTAIPGWTWVNNKPSNFPLPGAIVVWGPNSGHGIGTYGHVDIALWADALRLLGLDQDWPLGSLCTFVVHDYLGVLGWHTPPPH